MHTLGEYIPRYYVSPELFYLSYEESSFYVPTLQCFQYFQSI